MSAAKKISILGFFTLLCIPFLRSQNLFDVYVTWSFRESNPTEHTITFQDKTFVIPAGQSVKQVHQLKGGASVAGIYTLRGWGFLGQQVVVDGKEIPLNRIHTAQVKGRLRVLGIGQTPSMSAEIIP